MRWIIPVAAILLAGCNGLFGRTEAERVENEYEIAKTAVIDPMRKRCEAATKAAQAYAAEGNAEKSRQWELDAYNDCSAADRGVY